MNAPDPDRIAVTFTLTVDDYARYFWAVGRRRRSWTPWLILSIAFSCAIPTALLFRHLAAQRLDDMAAIETVGLDSLLAFAFGVFATMIALSIIDRMRSRKYFTEAADRTDSQTVTLERTGVTLSRKTTQSRLQWAAVMRCTRESDLLLLWLAPASAMPIPCRSFDSPGACEAAFAFVRARLAEAAAATAAGSPSPPAGTRHSRRLRQIPFTYQHSIDRDRAPTRPSSDC